MMRGFLLLLLVFCCCISAGARFRYKFNDTTTAYSPLPVLTALSDSLVWDEENLTAPMPFLWKMDSSFVLNKFNLVLSGRPSLAADTSNPRDLNGFYLADADFADRGYLVRLPLSPIKYQTTGLSPNRIFKLELSNAGFWQEAYMHFTMNDYINIQVWVYETSNVVELHFGPSQITYPSIYFNFGGGGPSTGYASHVNNITDAAGKLYYLHGNAATPGVDTAVLPALPRSSLSAWPDSGQVYRYTPDWTDCINPVSAFAAGSVSGQNVQYTYTGSLPIDSLRWDFGDGASSTDLNPAHTFSTNGRYRVCVTAYNSCGSDTYCKPIALAVTAPDLLENVRAYPNPAGDHLFIEGMPAGSKAILQTLIGQPVLSADIYGRTEVLSLNELPPGTYILILIRADAGRRVVKIEKR